MQQMTPRDAASELARLERELQAARTALRRDPATQSQPPVAGVFRTGVLVAVVLVAGAVVVAGILEGSTVAVVVALVVLVVSGAATVHVLRRVLLPANRAVTRATRIPRDRQRQLLSEVDAVYAALGERRPAVSADPLALPRARQPGMWAQTMHGRFGRGDPPADVLRRLPEDALPARVWFHRKVGPSGLLALTIVAVVLVVSTVGLVLQIRADL